MIDDDNDPYRRLGNAIVDQAITDYLKCCKTITGLIAKRTRLEKNRKIASKPLTIEKIDKKISTVDTAITKQEYEMQLIETFINSEWFTELTDRNPDRILGKLKDEVKKYDSKRIPKSAIHN